MQKVILSLALGFIFGVAFSGIENSIFLILCGFAISFLVFIYCRLFETGGVRELGLLVSIFLIAFSFGQIRFLVFEKNISKDLSFYENKKVDFTGIVFKESQSDGLRQKVFVDVKRIKTVGGYKDVNSKIIVFTSLYPKFSYGDNVSGSGKITKPEKIESDTGLYFDYPKYLAKDKITHLIYFGSLETLSFGGGNFFTRKLISLKNIFIGSVSKTLKEPELSLAAGIIFGSQNTSKDLVNVFRISGLSHITVLSGYNITIVAENILKILLPISRFANIFSIVSIFLFIVLSGASSTSIRAGIMASLAILGRRFGKTYSAGRALFFALFLMVLWNPFILLYDPSFHLSFLSTVAIIYLAPIVFEKLSFITEKFSLREIISTTISAQVFVLPYIIFMTGKFSLYGLFSNILVLPFVPFSMFLGFWTGLLGIFSKYLSLPFSLPLYFLLKYFIVVAEKIANLPFSQVSVPNIGIFSLVLVYLVFGFFLLRGNNQ